MKLILTASQQSETEPMKCEVHVESQFGGMFTRYRTQKADNLKILSSALENLLNEAVINIDSYDENKYINISDLEYIAKKTSLTQNTPHPSLSETQSLAEQSYPWKKTFQSLNYDSEDMPKLFAKLTQETNRAREIRYQLYIKEQPLTLSTPSQSLSLGLAQ